MLGVFGDFGEVRADFVGDVEVFGRESEGLVGFVDELGATFAVGAGGSGDFGDAPADEGFGDDCLGLSSVEATNMD